MPKKISANVRLMEAIAEQLGELKAILRDYDFDLEECEIDEVACVDEHGEEMFRIYELLKELEEITRDY